MGVSLKQDLDLLDYFAPIAVWICFFSIVLGISVTCILWCCVSDKDDQTVFAKYGYGPRGRAGTDFHNRFHEQPVETLITKP
uniref:Uncharacterized protein n=1 Tax=Panagrolaimus superbus TaxID=310955 RepID=A0A914Z089_9BILA